MSEIENKNHKDTVFRLLYKDKAKLLELYNAVHGTNYTNPDEIIITTLNGDTYFRLRNDVSFILHSELNLYEHQSTPFDNIPIRMLYYFADYLHESIPMKKTYKNAKNKIPTPRFIVFYNGQSDMPDQKVCRLSDLFEVATDCPDIELIVTAYNINRGHNKALMEACKTLKEYSIFVDKVRQYTKEANVSYSKLSRASTIDSKEYAKLITLAVTKAIDECITENILKDFFIKHRKAAIKMSVKEYTDEMFYSELASDSFAEGVQCTAELFSWLYTNNRSDDAKKASTDPAFLSSLFTEYNTWKKNNSNR